MTVARNKGCAHARELWANGIKRPVLRRKGGVYRLKVLDKSVKVGYIN